MNNFIITGDWHITDQRPENRKDNYEDSVFDKLDFILKIAKKNNCGVLQPGDFFDNPNPSYRLFTRTVSLLNKYKEVRVLSIFGQHCLRYRTKENTASIALEQSCRNFIILGSNGTRFDKEMISFYGSSYGEAIPKPVDDCFNILLIHRMIVKEKLWNTQEDFVESNTFLKQNNYDLIVSGDNHQGFISTVEKRMLVNCGSMMRSTINQINHKPFVVLFDTETKKYKQIFVPIEPAENVFKIDKIEKDKERNKELDAFVSGLSEQKEMGLSFMDNLEEYVIKNNIDSTITEIIKECSHE